LISNFHKMNKITKFSLIILFFCFVFYSRADADRLVSAQTSANNPTLTKAQLFSKQIENFLKTLKKAPKGECTTILGKYRGVIAREINLDKLYFVSYKDVEKLLDQAVIESIDSLTLFTHPLLQDQKRFAILFNEDLLNKINHNFDLHALFNISIPAIDGGPDVKMKFFILGQGKIIVCYNRNAEIRHPDYAFATGNYDYKELFTMDFKKDLRGNRGLFNIMGRSSPHEKPQYMEGPLNASIHLLIITSDPAGRPQILIQYSLFGNKQKLLKPIPIEKLYNG
jgi:hypothetical protein